MQHLGKRSLDRLPAQRLALAEHTAREQRLDNIGSAQCKAIGVLAGLAPGTFQPLAIAGAAALISSPGPQTPDPQPTPCHRRPSLPPRLARPFCPRTCP